MAWVSRAGTTPLSCAGTTPGRGAQLRPAAVCVVKMLVMRATSESQLTQNSLPSGSCMTT